jgi:hypothetical protein
MRFRFEQDRVDGAGRAGHPVAWRGTSRPAAARPSWILLGGATLLIATGCVSGEASAGRWNGTIDTLPSGQVVVHNTADPIWTDETRWRLVEDLRIGSVDAEGPELFGNVMDLAADAAGRIYVLEGQAKELRIFDANGVHLATAGREGGGPGEFAQPLMMDWGRDGALWIVDPSNNRISRFDTTGTFLGSIWQPGGFVIVPWPGRFDNAGNYYGPVPVTEEIFRIGYVRYDTAFVVQDTLVPPRDPVEPDYFQNDRGNIRAGIPYSAGFFTRLSDHGTFMGVFTGEYRFVEISAAGDTLRTFTRDFEALPVTAADRDSAEADLEWFTRQGGRIDLSRLPAHKPAVRNFFWDDEENVWVIPVTERERQQRVAHVFDPAGRFLGEVSFPFRLSGQPYPVFRDGFMYAVTTDEMEVPYVVRARLEKGGATE